MKPSGRQSRHEISWGVIALTIGISSQAYSLPEASEVMFKDLLRVVRSLRFLYIFYSGRRPLYS